MIPRPMKVGTHAGKRLSFLHSVAEGDLEFGAGVDVSVVGALASVWGGFSLDLAEGIFSQS